MERSNEITVRFWGVRGSVPAPITPACVEAKVLTVLSKAQSVKGFASFSAEELAQWLRTEVPFEERSTYGGNTTCVEVRCGSVLMLIDMGTGLREFGAAALAETFEKKGLNGFIFQSHVHWDHIQGLPFLPQLYMPKSVVKNSFKFYGGKEWDANLEAVLQGQMDPPKFPVQFGEIRRTGMEMEFHSVHDGWEMTMEDSDGNPVHILARKLNHPQETFGYRITYGSAVFCFTTDHEPYGNDAIHRGLAQLAKNADLWVTDCQYSLGEYLGENGTVQKCGWGHSYPEYLATIAKHAGVRRILTTHHDPAASDQHIASLANELEQLSGIMTRAAYEGLTLHLSAESTTTAS